MNLGYPGIPGTFFPNSREFPEPGITNIREFPQPYSVLVLLYPVYTYMYAAYIKVWGEQQWSPLENANLNEPNV